MTLYLVQNNDGIVMAICTTRGKANAIAVKIGQERWHEAWMVTPMEADKLDDPSMACGSDCYRKMHRILKERAERDAKRRADQSNSNR